jgi:hypothetical protein
MGLIQHSNVLLTVPEAAAKSDEWGVEQPPPFVCTYKLREPNFC